MKDIHAFLSPPAEMARRHGPHDRIVMSSRVRLARNLRDAVFPGWAKKPERVRVLELIRPAIENLPEMKDAFSEAMENLGALDKQILVERHLISREHAAKSAGSGLVFSRDEMYCVMINEEDHLRIQVLRAGFQLKKTWSTIDELDSVLEEQLDYAFSSTLGYLTACPTNLGTAMRASAMMHLPALVISSQMEKVVRAVNQLGMVVRGLFGEGSDANGSIFQISNQTTLGESEDDIIKRLQAVLQSIVEHEVTAREKLLEADAAKLSDKIGRAYGILQNSHLLNSSEAMNLLSLIRLGVDLGLFPEEHRATIARLFIEAQPGHLQYKQKGEFEPAQRDLLRAACLRTEFATFARPHYTADGKN